MYPTVGASPADCDRNCLNDLAEQYLTALKAHDPARAPLAPGARYSENGVELPLDRKSVV